MIGGQFSALVACFLYVSLNSFPVAPGYIYLSSDLFFGISTGAVSIWRAHVAMTSTEKDRAKAFSMAGLAIFLGMTFGPILMVFIGYLLPRTGIQLLFSLNLSIYTFPGGRISFLYCNLGLSLIEKKYLKSFCKLPSLLDCSR
uniref:Uncharacterized protein n=1 Tax=Ditylenchus dipsaci TaxID=166011 RepID=A0A915D7U2_9BILA